MVIPTICIIFAPSKEKKREDYGSNNAKEKEDEGREHCHQLKENAKEQKNEVCAGACRCLHRGRPRTKSTVTVMRTLVDTCVIIDWATDPEALDDGVWDIIDDPENRIYISAETVRELVVNYNSKKLLTKYWDCAKDMLDTIENEYGVEVLPITRDVVATYTTLRLNEADNHYDPSDHIIISHAITERLTLISSDTKFPFYRNQGLELIEY